MGDVIVKIKIMPKSSETNLEEVQKKVQTTLEQEEAKGNRFEEQPIAFGLKALFVTFLWPEEKGLEPLEKKLEKIEDVGSVKIEDMRRAIG